MAWNQQKWTAWPETWKGMIFFWKPKGLWHDWSRLPARTLSMGASFIALFGYCEMGFAVPEPATLETGYPDASQSQMLTGMRLSISFTNWHKQSVSAYSRYEVPFGSAFKMAKRILPIFKEISTPKAWRDLSHHPFTIAKVPNGRRPSAPSSARKQKRGSNSRKWPRPGLSNSISCYGITYHSISSYPIAIFIITNKEIQYDSASSWWLQYPTRAKVDLTSCSHLC